MSRDDSRVIFSSRPGAIASATTVTTYFVLGDRPVMTKYHYFVGIEPAAADGDTVADTWDYSTDGSNFTTISTQAAIEYNDTDNTLAATALVPSPRPCWRSDSPSCYYDWYSY